MRVLVASEVRFVRAAGRVWTTGPEDYGFWASYAGAFDRVEVLARVEEASWVPGGARPADGGGVVFHPAPAYLGPVQYLVRLPELRAAAARAAAGADAFLLRAPGAIAYLAWEAIRRLRRPYGVEVLGDPWESLGPASGLRHPLQPLARRWSRRRLRVLCRDAAAACYVAPALHERYPAGGAVRHCPDIRLDALAPEAVLEARRARARDAARGLRPWRLGFAGSLERLYKAPEVHLAAVALCRRAGRNVTLEIAGDGRFRPWLERRAARLGLEGAVRFLGALPAGRPVEAFLDSLDLFLLASRTEGLPRALIEAMARGCPAIGSTAGGIPDLLLSDELVPPGSASALAARIEAYLADPGRLIARGERNRDEAQQYLWDRIGPRRREFLWTLRNCST